MRHHGENLHSADLAKGLRFCKMRSWMDRCHRTLPFLTSSKAMTLAQGGPCPANPGLEEEGGGVSGRSRGREALGSDLHLLQHCLSTTRLRASGFKQQLEAGRRDWTGGWWCTQVSGHCRPGCPSKPGRAEMETLAYSLTFY
jgi:hypothetical protein